MSTRMSSFSQLQPLPIPLVLHVVTTTTRKVPQRKWRAHGSGAPPTRAGEWDPARAPRHPRGTQWGEAAAPPCSHSLFESQFESPTRPPTGTWRRPLGVPVGTRDAPSGSARRAEWDLGGAEWEVRQHRVGPASRTLPRPTRPRGGRLDPEMAPVALATNLQGRRRRQRARRENRPPMQAHKGSPYPSDAS